MARAAAAAALAALAVLGPAGCGTKGPPSTRISSDTLTIYTGLPLRGERAAQGRAVLRGEKLALDEAGGRVGRLGIGLIALDDTRTSTGRWDPRRVAENLRQVAENPTTIAYVGDLDSGATAVSLPIANEIGVLQVSPLSGYTGLTRPLEKGEPEKYYPSGRRTFGRLVPTGAQEARALAAWVRRAGLRRVTLVYDGLQEGLGRGTELERALLDERVDVPELVPVDPRDEPAQRAAAVRDVLRARGPAVVYAGASTPTAATVLRRVARQAPGTALFATSGVDARALAAALPASARLRVTSPLLPLAARPPDARRVAAHYREHFGGPAPPAALFGYEAMRAVLDAIRRAGRNGNDRRAVVAAFFSATHRRSVLGPWSVDARGDTSAGAVGAYVARGGRLRFVRALPVAGD